jgi:hypothetical protein
LTDEQKNRLFKQSVKSQLSVPATVLNGPWLSFQVREWSRITIPYFYVAIVDRAEKIDDRVIDQPGGGDGLAGLGASGSSGSSVPCPALGAHTLTVVVHIELHDRNSSGPVMYSEDRVLTAPFKVVESRQ